MKVYAYETTQHTNFYVRDTGELVMIHNSGKESMLIELGMKAVGAKIIHLDTHLGNISATIERDLTPLQVRRSTDEAMELICQRILVAAAEITEE